MSTLHLGIQHNRCEMFCLQKFEYMNECKKLEESARLKLSPCLNGVRIMNNYNCFYIFFSSNVISFSFEK